MYVFNGPIPNRLVPIPRGTAGTSATLRLMAQLADEGARDVSVRQRAIAIVQTVAPHDTLGELRALFQWVRDRVRFVGDALGLETLQTPTRTLAWGAGDCDDMATLLVALARSIGIPARLAFRAIGTDRRRPAAFGHVYVVANVNGRDYPMDPIYRTTPFGWQYPAPTVRADLAL